MIAFFPFQVGHGRLGPVGGRQVEIRGGVTGGEFSAHPATVAGPFLPR